MNPNDQVRIDALKRIFDAGMGDHALMSNDICMRSRLHLYGGWGYDHIQTNLFPFLRQSGFGDRKLPDAVPRDAAPGARDRALLAGRSRTSDVAVEAYRRERAELDVEAAIHGPERGPRPRVERP